MRNGLGGRNSVVRELWLASAFILAHPAFGQGSQCVRTGSRHDSKRTVLRGGPHSRTASSAGPARPQGADVDGHGGIGQRPSGRRQPLLPPGARSKSVIRPRAEESRRQRNGAGPRRHCANAFRSMARFDARRPRGSPGLRAVLHGNRRNSQSRGGAGENASRVPGARSFRRWGTTRKVGAILVCRASVRTGPERLSRRL